MMTIQLATSDADILACWPVMHELRPHLARPDFVARVRDQQHAGYHLAFLDAGAGPVAIAGFRVLQNLAWGRFLYVDDLVTASAERSRGHGAALLAWLRAEAQRAGCAQLHLDSGVQRREAHRFYERDGMSVTAYHFACLANGERDT